MIKLCLACCLFLLTSSSFGQQITLPAHPATATKKTSPEQTSDAQSQLQAAQSLVDHGQLDEALRATDALVKQTPEPKHAERLRGKIFYLKADFEDADKAFQKASEQDPSDKESIQLRGSTLFRMGKAAAAIPLLEQSHKNLRELNLDGNYVLALCYLTTRRYDDARRSFALLYGMTPDSAQAYLLLGRMLMRWQNTPAAKEMGEKALAINPRLPLAHLLLGQAALGLGNLDEALVEFQHEAAINPLNGSVYDRLGDVYLQKNEFEKAQDALNQALVLEPDATGPYILLGQVLLKRDNPTSAIIYLKRATQMDPGNEYSHFFLGQAYRAMGKRQEATAEFAIAQKIKAATK